MCSMALPIACLIDLSSTLCCCWPCSTPHFTPCRRDSKGQVQGLLDAMRKCLLLELPPLPAQMRMAAPPLGVVQYKPQVWQECERLLGSGCLQGKVRSG